MERKVSIKFPERRYRDSVTWAEAVRIMREDNSIFAVDENSWMPENANAGLPMANGTSYYNLNKKKPAELGVSIMGSKAIYASYRYLGAGIYGDLYKPAGTYYKLFRKELKPIFTEVNL